MSAKRNSRRGHPGWSIPSRATARLTTLARVTALFELPRLPVEEVISALSLEEAPKGPAAVQLLAMLLAEAGGEETLLEGCRPIAQEGQLARPVPTGWF